MKNKKINYIIIFLLVLLLPFKVNAEESCGSLNINAISPLNISESLREDYIRNLESQGVVENVSFRYNDLLQRFNENFTDYIINVQIENENKTQVIGVNLADATQCHVTLTWAAYDEEKAEEILDFMKSIESVIYPDLYIEKYYKENVEYINPIYNQENNTSTYTGWKTTYPNIIPKMTDHITVKEKYFTLSAGTHSYTPPYKLGRLIENFADESSLINVYYDDTVYGVMSDPYFYLYEVLYIPEYTKETKADYIKALSTRLDTVLGKGTVSECETCNNASQNEQEYNYFKSMLSMGLERNYIDSNLNKTFDPFVVTVQYENLTGHFLVAKASKEQVLDNTNTAYADLYYANDPANAEVIEKIPNTGLTSSKIILIVGSILVISGYLIIKNVKKKGL